MVCSALRGMDSRVSDAWTGRAARDWFGCRVQARLAESGWCGMVRQSWQGWCVTARRGTVRQSWRGVSDAVCMFRTGEAVRDRNARPVLFWQTLVREARCVEAVKAALVQALHGQGVLLALVLSGQSRFCGVSCVKFVWSRIGSQGSVSRGLDCEDCGVWQSRWCLVCTDGMVCPGRAAWARRVVLGLVTKGKSW